MAKLETLSGGGDGNACEGGGGVGKGTAGGLLGVLPSMTMLISIALPPPGALLGFSRTMYRSASQVGSTDVAPSKNLFKHATLVLIGDANHRRICWKSAWWDYELGFGWQCYDLDVWYTSRIRVLCRFFIFSRLVGLCDEFWLTGVR